MHLLSHLLFIKIDSVEADQASMLRKELVNKIGVSIKQVLQGHHFEKRFGFFIIQELISKFSKD
jgi:hypothetical protein